MKLTLPKLILLTFTACTLLLVGCGGSGVGSKSQRFVFAASTSSDSLHSYRQEADFSLTEITSVATGDTPTSVVVTPDQKYVVVSHSDAAHLRVYQISSDGHLAAAETLIVPLPSPARNIALNKSRNMIYAACSNANTVVGFEIGSNGSLTSTVSVADLANVRGVTVSPSGNHLYSLVGTNKVAQFSVGNAGELTALDPATATTIDEPIIGSITPIGNRFYAGSQSVAELTQFNIINGKLSGGVIPPSAPTINGGTLMLSIDRNSKYVFQSSNAVASIGRMKINGDGSLTALSPLAYNFGAGAAICFADPHADILYAATQDGHVGVYDILSNGNLTFRSSTTFAPEVYGASFADVLQP